MPKDFFEVIAAGGFAGDAITISEADFASAATGVYVPGERGVFRIVAARASQLLVDSPVQIETTQTSAAIVRMPGGSLPTVAFSDARRGREYVISNAGTGSITVEKSDTTAIGTITSGNTAYVTHLDADDWNITFFVGVNVFDFLEDLTTRATTSTTFINYMTLTTAAIPAGDYRITWHYVWGFSSVAHDFSARVQVDGADLVSEHQQEPKDAGANQRYHASGFNQITLTAAAHTISLDFRRVGPTGTSTIYEARAEIRRIL